MFRAAVTCLSLFALQTSAAKCLGMLNSTFPFEEVCYQTLYNNSDGLSVRAYSGADASAQLVSFNVSAAEIYQEALEMSTFYVISYFAGEGNKRNKSLTAARTVPLVLRPPTSEHNLWTSHMALAPSHFPPGSKAPAPGWGITVSPLGDVTLAVLHGTLYQSPQPSDFDELCSTAAAAVKAQLPDWTIDPTSPFSPSHARYFSYEFYEGPFDIECWWGLMKV
jgi:hypothetical protein